MTTINEALTPLGDGFRNLYGISDKLSAKDMAKLLSGLQIHNLLDDGQYFDTTKGDSNYKILNGLDLATWQKYVGKTLLISFDVNWSGYKNDSSKNNRTGIEYGIKFKNSPEVWFGAWLYPDSPSGSKHIYTFYNLPNDEVTEIEEGSYFNQVNDEAVIKATNFKVVVNPLGGVVPANLFEGHFTFDSSLVKRSGNLYQFYVTKISNTYSYTSMIFITNRVQAKENQSYKLKFKARGNGQIWSYVYGNNYQGTYVDNGHPWQLSNQWQDYEQLFPIDSIPVKDGGLLVDIRTLNPIQGEIADIEFIPI